MVEGKKKRPQSPLSGDSSETNVQVIIRCRYDTNELYICIIVSTECLAESLNRCGGGWLCCQVDCRWGGYVSRRDTYCVQATVQGRNIYKYTRGGSV